MGAWGIPLPTHSAKTLGETNCFFEHVPIMRVIGVPITLSIPIRSLDKRFFSKTLDGISGSVKVL
jgi:hypothetical protein